MATSSERTATRLPVERSFPALARVADLTLRWPSGRGEEIGVVEGTLEEAWQSVRRNHGATGRDFAMHEVREQGAEALVLEGLAGTPVTFATEPELAEGRLAIYADSAADVQEVRHAVEQLLPGMSVTFHGPIGSGTNHGLRSLGG